MSWYDSDNERKVRDLERKVRDLEYDLDRARQEASDWERRFYDERRAKEQARSLASDNWNLYQEALENRS